MGQKKRELVIFGDDFWNTYGIIRSLGEEGHRPCFINICEGRSFVKRSRYIDRYVQVSSVEEGIKALKAQFGYGEEKSLVLCSSDATVSAIDENLEELSERFITFNCKGKPGDLTRLMGKDAMIEMAKEVGMTVPFTLSLDLTEDIDKLDLSQVPFPCLTKSENSLDGGKDNLCRCDNLEELIGSLKNAKERGCRRVQVQEFVEKEYEMMITGCADGKGNVVMPGIIKKLTEWPMGFTALASIDPDIEKYIEPDLIAQYVVKCGFCGVFSVEFLLSKRKMCFMEINLRNDGNGYASTPGGVNIHKIWVDMMAGDNKISSKRRIDRKYDFTVEPNSLNFHVNEANGYKSFLKEFLKVDFRLICNLKDPMPGIWRFGLGKIFK